MATDNGPASSTPSLFLGTPPTCGVEVHVGNPSSALNPQPPSEQNNPVDPQIGTTKQTQTRLNLNLGGAGIRFVNPA